MIAAALAVFACAGGSATEAGNPKSAAPIVVASTPEISARQAEDPERALARVLREQSGSYCDQIPSTWQRYTCMIDRMRAEASAIFAKHDRMKSDAGIGFVAYIKLVTDPSMGVGQEYERAGLLLVDTIPLAIARCRLLEENAERMCFRTMMCAAFSSETERQDCLRSVEATGDVKP